MHTKKRRSRQISRRVCEDFDKLTHRQASEAGKIADRVVLSQNGLLYYVGRRRELTETQVDDNKMRLVIVTTLVDEIQKKCRDSMEGGHQEIVRTYHKFKTDYYRADLYADVVRHVQACEDCSTRKTKPALKGYSPGNIVFERPY